MRLPSFLRPLEQVITPIEKGVSQAAKAVEKGATEAASAVVHEAKQAVDLFEVPQPKPAAPGSTIPSGQPDPAYDGAMIGGDGKFYAASTPLSQVPTFKPQSGQGKGSGGTIVFVNGVGIHHQSVARMCQQLANESGDPVVGVDNATNGSFKDILQSVEDTFHVGKNPATDTMTNLIYDSLKQGKPLHILGYSQGGIIVPNALYAAQSRLEKNDGWSQAQVQSKMHDLLKVETFAGGGHDFPDGPQYVHYVNNEDIVPELFGVGLPFPWTHPGAGAQVRRFNYFVPNLSDGEEHAFSQYLSHRVPFSEAYPS